MNCCNEFGECRQGRDCPVRRTSDWPTVTYRTGWARLDNVLKAISCGVAVLAAMCVVALLITLICMTGALQ